MRGCFLGKCREWLGETDAKALANALSRSVSRHRREPQECPYRLVTRPEQLIMGGIAPHSVPVHRRVHVRGGGQLWFVCGQT